MEADAEEAETNVTVARDLAEDYGKAYRHAPEHMKRALNKTFFTKILVHETDQPGDFELEGQLEPPFDVLFRADIRKAVAEIQKAEQSQPRDKKQCADP